MLLVELPGILVISWHSISTLKFWLLLFIKTYHNLLSGIMKKRLIIDSLCSSIRRKDTPTISQS